MNTMIRKTYLLVLSLILSVVYVLASEIDSVSRKVIHIIGADFRPAYVFPTHEFFRGANSTGERLSSIIGQDFKLSSATAMQNNTPDWITLRQRIKKIDFAFNASFTATNQR